MALYFPSHSREGLNLQFDLDCLILLRVECFILEPALNITGFSFITISFVIEFIVIILFFVGEFSSKPATARRRHERMTVLWFDFYLFCLEARSRPGTVGI